MMEQVPTPEELIVESEDLSEGEVHVEPKPGKAVNKKNPKKNQNGKKKKKKKGKAAKKNMQMTEGPMVPPMEDFDTSEVPDFMIPDQQNFAELMRPHKWIKKPAVLKQGDWLCANPACKNINFSRRNHCNLCGSKKATATADVITALCKQYQEKVGCPHCLRLLLEGNEEGDGMHPHFHEIRANYKTLISSSNLPELVGDPDLLVDLMAKEESYPEMLPPPPQVVPLMRLPPVLTGGFYGVHQGPTPFYF
jgi:hypothetical protein